MLKLKHLQGALAHEEMLERAAWKAANGVVPAPVWACPWCAKPAPGWRLQELTLGRRWEGNTKHYHCREAAAED